MQKNGWQLAALKGGESLPAKPSLVPVGCRDTLEMDPHHHSVLQNCFNYDETMFKLRDILHVCPSTYSMPP